MGLATIALDVAALAVSAQPTPLPIINPRAPQIITRIIAGVSRKFELVEPEVKVLLRDVADYPEFRGIVMAPDSGWHDLASRPQRADITLEYQGRRPNQVGHVYPDHFHYFAGTDAAAKKASLNGKANFAPGVGDDDVRLMIDEALRKHRTQFSHTYFSQLNGYVYDAGVPFGRGNAFRLDYQVGYADGECTSRIKIQVGRNGTVHAFPTLERASTGGSIFPPPPIN